MGQAKLRGSYEQRQVEGVQKRIEREKAKEEYLEQREMSLTRKQKKCSRAYWHGSRNSISNERPTMTDKHIPSSKLLALKLYFADIAVNKTETTVLYSDLRALIDETQESVEPVAIVDKSIPTCEIQYTDGVGDNGLPDGTPLFVAPRPNHDLTKLVWELVEALEDARDDVAECLNHDLPHKGWERYDMRIAQREQQLKTIDALLTRAKDYLK